MRLRRHAGLSELALTAFMSFVALGQSPARAQQQPPPAPPPEGPAPAPPPEAPAPAPPEAPAAAPPPPPAAALPVENATPAVEAPLAGYHNGYFYLRSKDDLFRLYPQGRINLDSLNYFGPGVPSLAPSDALKSTLT